MDAKTLYSKETLDKLRKIADKSTTKKRKKKGHRKCAGCGKNSNAFKKRINEIKGN